MIPGGVSVLCVCKCLRVRVRVCVARGGASAADLHHQEQERGSRVWTQPTAPSSRFSPCLRATTDGRRYTLLTESLAHAPLLLLRVAPLPSSPRLLPYPLPPIPSPLFPPNYLLVASLPPPLLPLNPRLALFKAEREWNGQDFTWHYCS